MWAWSAAVLAAILIGIVSSVPATPAGAHPLDVPSHGIVTACWFDTRVFDSLRLGPVTYCRRRMAYTPGALDCYQFTDQVCTVLLPASAALTEMRLPVAPHLFPCPDAPEPPMCPRLGWRGRWQGGEW
jgi:hypothetical protein